MRMMTMALSLLLAMTALTGAAAAADAATVHAILITASQDKAPADPKLAPYEATLQRNLPDSSFRYAGEGSASVSGSNSRARISLPSGHQVELQGGNRDADGIVIKVQWMNGKTVLMNNSFTFQPGVPVVLARRPSGDGNMPIVILIAK